ncbi:MAG TPA: hypothetical protein VGD42_02295, partial [Lysobacter sp.]
MSMSQFENATLESGSPTATDPQAPEATVAKPPRANTSATTLQLWFDGYFIAQDEAAAPLTTHAMHYGTGVFEGIRSYATRDGAAVFRLPEHLERMRQGAQALGI